VVDAPKFDTSAPKFDTGAPKCDAGKPPTALVPPHILYYFCTKLRSSALMNSVPNGTIVVSFGTARFQDHVRFARVVKTTATGKLSIQPVDEIVVSSRTINHLDTEVISTYGNDLPAQKKILMTPVGDAAFGKFHAPGTDGRAYWGGGMHWHVMQRGLFAKAAAGSGRAIDEKTVSYVHGLGA
jgi:hypothetical protein